MTDDFDDAFRAAAFAYLADQVRRHGETLPWTVLTSGFQFGDRKVALMNPRRGIRKPGAIELPISLTTTPLIQGRERPYDDATDYEDRLLLPLSGHQSHGDPPTDEVVGLLHL